MTHWINSNVAAAINATNNWTANVGKWVGFGDFISTGAFAYEARILAYSGTGMIDHTYRFGEKIFLKKITTNIAIGWNNTNTTPRSIMIALVRWIKPENVKNPTISDIWDTSLGGWQTNPVRNMNHLKDYKIMWQRTMKYSPYRNESLTRLTRNTPINRTINYPVQSASPNNSENLCHLLFMICDNVDSTNSDTIHAFERLSFYP